MDAVTVLIVDDSLTTVKKLTSMLESLGHKVVGCARNGRDAVAAFQTLQPDLVTMDITMPGMNGVEATRRIVEENPSARVIIVTAFGHERMVMDAFDVGALGYLLKPLRLEKLSDMIDKVMTRRQ